MHVADVVRFLSLFKPSVVAVDAPMTHAERDETSRRCEREFFREGICHLYWTPSLAEIDRNPSTSG